MAKSSLWCSGTWYKDSYEFSYKASPMPLPAADCQVGQVSARDTKMESEAL